MVRGGRKKVEIFDIDGGSIVGLRKVKKGELEIFLFSCKLEYFKIVAFFYRV